ncbi:MAG: hypothetical protein KC457_16320 [Myxococcales bacterium]|nr:hypothetical protein [Myxococcales bacterium]
MATPFPDEEQVWQAVRTYAEAHRDSGEPVYTLQHGVANQITAVESDFIERQSARTRSGRPSRITRAELGRVWRALADNGHVFTAGHTVFVPALIRRALPDLISDCGNMISLEGFAETEEPSPTARLSRAPAESPAHWALKHYIHQYPQEALADFPGGPWTRARLEFGLPTHDCIDVVVTDEKGAWCLVEVKPFVGANDRRWFAQAAKYRCIWQILWPELQSVRCLLVAPSIAQDLAREMMETFDIESLELQVPADFTPPPQARALTDPGS